MENRRISGRHLMVGVAAIFICLTPLCRTGMAAEFSADLSMRGKDQEPISGKIFVQGDKIRQEIVERGESQVMIFRPDKGVIWMVTPGEEMYMEMPYQADNKRFENWSPQRESNAKYVDEETVSGLRCKKYEMEEYGDKTYYWVSDKIPLPVRVEYRDGTMEYRNIKEETLPESLFEVPSEFTKMVMPILPEVTEQHSSEGP